MAACRLVGGAAGARRAEFFSAGLRALTSKINGVCQEGDDKVEKMTSIRDNLQTERTLFVPEITDLVSAVKRLTSTKTMPFKVKTGNAAQGSVKNLIDVLDADLTFYNESVDVDQLKEIYKDVVEPALVARCLLSPFKLKDSEAAALHEAYKRITKLKIPYYISSLDLMVTLKCMKKGDWAYFLDFLSAKRVLVIEDWSKSYGTLFGVGRYDHGLQCPPDAEKFYKGECDASVSMKDGKARVSAIIWKGNQVVACQVLVDIPCEQKKGDEKGRASSAKAEALAMYYLLKLAIAMGIKNIQVSTDNRTVDEVLRGAHEISEDSDCKDIYRVLRYLRRYFSSLVSRWEPRENLYFADGLLRSFDRPTPGFNSVKIQALLRKWSYHLNGYPVFYLTQKKSALLKGLNVKLAQLQTIEKACYLEVEESAKFDAFWHMSVALRPKNIFIAVKDLGSRNELVNQLKELFEDCEVDVVKYDEYSVISICLAHRPDGMQPTKSVTVIFDSSVPRKAWNHKDSLNVVLVTPDERRRWRTIPFDIPQFSPLSFASLHDSDEKK